ncbi:hypothetical protein QFC21_006323 [Naganishia friedmannii]|uniref:Uncharacterized protein n=1 Tax=Naganishia friedmannii TaxID=89922 RepID=A0ACC2V3A6_9TREE|nr:hypothetical protein QFC21_006323 [Naganishia friedmannii]
MDPKPSSPPVPHSEPSTTHTDDHDALQLTPDLIVNIAAVPVDSCPPQEAAAALKPTSPRGVCIIAITMTAQMIDNMFSVTIALPTIANDLGIRREQYLWILSAGLGAAATVPSAIGTLGNSFKGVHVNTGMAWYGAGGSVGWGPFVMYMILLAQDVLGFSALQTGIRLIPFGGFGFVVTVSVGILLRWFNVKTLVVGGLLVSVISNVPLGIIHPSTNFWAVGNSLGLAICSIPQDVVYKRHSQANHAQQDLATAELNRLAKSLAAGLWTAMALAGVGVLFALVGIRRGVRPGRAIMEEEGEVGLQVREEKV